MLLLYADLTLTNHKFLGVCSKGKQGGPSHKVLEGQCLQGKKWAPMESRKLTRRGPRFRSSKRAESEGFQRGRGRGEGPRVRFEAKRAEGEEGRGLKEGGRGYKEGAEKKKGR
jgi:hypothetical protein